MVLRPRSPDNNSREHIHWREDFSRPLLNCGLNCANRLGFWTPTCPAPSPTGWPIINGWCSYSPALLSMDTYLNCTYNFGRSHLFGRLQRPKSHWTWPFETCKWVGYLRCRTGTNRSYRGQRFRYGFDSMSYPELGFEAQNTHPRSTRTASQPFRAAERLNSSHPRHRRVCYPYSSTGCKPIFGCLRPYK
jgi:hypothetical protein